MTTVIARQDHSLIEALIPQGARVLDIGCGDGILLQRLSLARHVDARGLELSQQGVNVCVAHGLAVIQGDADTDLDAYPDQAFDYVILSQTLQATRQPRQVMEELLRIGRHVVIALPNFGHWRVRLALLFGGRMPVTKSLPYSWYDTPNIHFCTLRDFHDLLNDIGAIVEQCQVLTTAGTILPTNLPLEIKNLFGNQAIFLLRGQTKTDQT